MVSKQREKFLLVAERVTRLRRELQEAEREFDALLASDKSQGTVAGSVPAKIMERIIADPGRSYSASDFRDLSGGDSALQYVRSSLHRLVKSKKLKKNGRGKFRLPAATKSGNATNAREGS